MGTSGPHLPRLSPHFLTPVAIKKKKKRGLWSSGPSPGVLSSSISELSQLFLTVEPQLTPRSLSLPLHFLTAALSLMAHGPQPDPGSSTVIHSLSVYSVSSVCVAMHAHVYVQTCQSDVYLDRREVKNTTKLKTRDRG